MGFLEYIKAIEETRCGRCLTWLQTYRRDIKDLKKALDEKDEKAFKDALTFLEETLKKMYFENCILRGDYDMAVDYIKDIKKVLESKPPNIWEALSKTFKDSFDLYEGEITHFVLSGSYFICSEDIYKLKKSGVEK